MRGFAATVALLVLTVSACGEPEESGGTPPDEAPLALQLPAASGRCGVPRAALLATADHAFGGTVAEVTGSDVSLRVDEWFAGREGQTVLVTTQRGARTTEGYPDFTRGERYLVAAVGTELLVCGYSGRRRPGLEQLYREAFDAPA